MLGQPSPFWRRAALRAFGVRRVTSRAFLHIGVEKTGTTTIQSFMAKNRTALMERGVFYPRAPGQENHAGLTIYAIDNPKQLYDLLPLANLTADADLDTYRRQMMLELKDSVLNAECETVVLSNEHCSSRVQPVESIARLRDALLGIVEDVRIIVYLRRQDEVVLSEYSTRVKSGYTEAFSIEPHHVKNYNYADLLERWSSAFGSKNVIPRIFENDCFHKNDLVSDFLSMVGVEDTTGLTTVSPQNASLDVDTLEFLRLVNKHLPAFVNGSYNAERGNIVDELTALSQGERPRLEGNQAAAILQLFAESNAEVARRYFGRGDGVLFSSAPDPSLPGNLASLSRDAAIRISAELWRRLKRNKNG